MSEEKKVIRKACKEAKAYRAWRNPMGVWYVTLFDNDDKSFLEFRYSDTFPKRDRDWISKQLDEINKRQKKGE